MGPFWAQLQFEMGKGNQLDHTTFMNFLYWKLEYTLTLTRHSLYGKCIFDFILDIQLSRYWICRYRFNYICLPLYYCSNEVPLHPSNVVIHPGKELWRNGIILLAGESLPTESMLWCHFNTPVTCFMEHWCFLHLTHSQQIIKINKS